MDSKRDQLPEQVANEPVPALPWRDLVPHVLCVALVAAAAMVFLHGSGLTDGGKYHGDLTQSPHWIAYHHDAFPDDDLLVRYATYNETPLQNAVYWVGTWFLDVVLLNKVVGIVIFCLTAACFFTLVASTAEIFTGWFAALLFIVFPRSSYEIAGGFSKAWAIGLVLLVVYVVETRRWRILVWSMPLAALAYPVAPVLMGAIAAVGLALELPGGIRRMLFGLKWLCAGSALALIPLLYKYLTPPDFVGSMISTGKMRLMWEHGESTSFTIPLWEEMLTYLAQPFFIYGAVVIFMLLYRRGLIWKRSWSALLIASAISYHVADLVVPRLYLPDRYIRYSMAVLLVLWFAHNGSRALQPISGRVLRVASLLFVFVLAAASFTQTFRPSVGQKAQGIWEDRTKVAEISRVIASLPTPVLVAGHPYATSDVMVQARRPVLVIHRMVHAWFEDYRRTQEKRIRATFRALYARDKASVNFFAEEYGVTHLVVRRTLFRKKKMLRGQIYREQFDEFIADFAPGPGEFVLNPPPPETVLFEDNRYWLVRLPLP